MTDEQIDSMMSAAIIRPIGGAVEPTKTDGISADAKTPLELQVYALNIRSSKQPLSSEQHWVEAIFDDAESLLGKDKVS